MADHTERWVVNHLIEMCRDEELALRFVADHVKDPSVRTLFVELASERARFAEDLVPHAQRLGGPEAAESTMRGALDRGWLALKAKLSGSSDRTMITEAERHEARALAAYEDALGDMLPVSAREVVEHQEAEIRRAHERVRGILMH